MSERPAAQEVSAEDLVVSMIEEIGHVEAKGKTGGDRIVHLQIGHAVRRNRPGVDPRHPLEAVYPAVTQPSVEL